MCSIIVEEYSSYEKSECCITDIVLENMEIDQDLIDHCLNLLLTIQE